MLAAYQGNPDVMKMLLRFPGIDVNVEDNNGNSAFLRAVDHGHHLVLEELIAHESFQMPQKNKLPVIRLLSNTSCLTYEDDVISKMVANDNTVRWPKLTRLVLSYITNPKPLIKAAEFGQSETVKLLMKEDVDINMTDNNGYTPLIWACDKNHNLSYGENNKVIQQENEEPLIPVGHHFDIGGEEETTGNTFQQIVAELKKKQDPSHYMYSCLKTAIKKGYIIICLED